MKALAIFGAVTVAIVVGLGWVVSLLYAGDAARTAILVSAAIAIVVQLLTFFIARRARETNVVAGWGLGALMRFAVLGAYGLVIVRAFALPMEPALLSLAAFFFLSTIVEPVLLTV